MAARGDRESLLGAGQTLMAKMIVLGDSRTGKSRLISSLDSRGSASGSRGIASSTEGDSLFSVIEFPAHELESTTSDVNLKMWEHTKGLSPSEEELVFRGALFCIITLDLRLPDTAKSAFNKWLSLKEAQMPESFLFVVGTFLDQSISRRVEIAELCKLCAQRDAVYLEVSNLDGSNVSLLRRLIAQRLNYMLRVRETVARQAPPDLSGHDDLLVDDALLDDSTADDGGGAGESKHHGNNVFSHLGPTAAERRESALKTPFLEQEIVCDSVGSILASCLGTEFWPGYEQEEENLKHIGEAINDYVHRIAADPASAPSTPLEHILHSTAPPLATTAQQQHAAHMGTLHTRAPDIDELKHVFEVMGFQVPQSLLTTAINAGPKRALATAMPSTKLRVKLPDGQSADMVLYPGYHVGQQVDAFLVQHAIEENEDAKAKLVEAANKVVAALARQHDAHEDEDPELQQQHYNNHQNTLLTAPPRLASGTASFAHPSPGGRSASAANTPSRHTQSPPKAGRKCRVRIQLPSGESIETVMRENEDLVGLSKRIALQHGLTGDFQERVLQQLRGSFK